MKRFTDTEKYSDPWFRKLPVLYKQFWDYLCARCDNAGVWKPDFELASFCIGEPLDEQKIIEALGDRIVILTNGKWWIRKFIFFQFGNLSPSSRPHQSILDLLKRHGIEYPKGIERVSEGIKTREDKDKDLVQGGTGGDFSEIPSLEEVTAQGNLSNVPAESCKAFYDHHQGNNLWINRHGQLINWRHKLQMWRENEKGHAGKNGKPTSPAATIYAAEAQKKVFEEQISKHKANPQSVFYDSKCGDLEKASLKDLRRKVRELDQKIASVHIS